MNDALSIDETKTSAEDVQLLRLDDQVCYAVYSASHALIRAYRPILDKLDLTYLQYMTLLVLWEKDGISVKDLGKKLHLDSGTLTPLLKRMAGKGLITREHSLVDERVRIIKLAENAAPIKMEMSKVPAQMVEKISMSLDQLIELKKLCESVTNNLLDSEI